MSSVFPDRLIHPLPKRRLRERLSPDVADAIKYPPAQVSKASLFYYPYVLKEDASEPVERPNALGRGRAATSPALTAPRQDTQINLRARRESEADELASSSRVIRLVNRSARPLPATPNSSPPESQPTAPSTASSVDGYDSFENTNNKKKRKIPTAGDTSHAGSYSSADVHTPGPSSVHANDGLPGGSPASAAYSGPASFMSGSPGISGPGRGRYGRSRGGRSPLRPLSDAGSNWAGRYGKLRPPWPSQPGGNTSIISNAIANAEKQASRGQENAGLLPQQSATSTPASAQFTFTCTSQVPGNLAWPGSDPKLAPGASQWQQGRLRGGYGQLLSGAIGGANPDGSVGSSSANRTPRGPGNGHARQSGKKKGRSKLSMELERQESERRRLQREQNRINPPTSIDDIYICPFCEFENINGYKPKYLIRSFEKKERQKRLEDDRRQRFLDKAKARGRKGKKPPRVAPAAKNDSQPQEPHAGGPDHDDGEAGDGYFEDDGGGEGDGYEPEDDNEVDKPAAANHSAAPLHANSSGGRPLPGTG